MKLNMNIVNKNMNKICLPSLFFLLSFGLNSCGGSCDPQNLSPVSLNLQLDYVGTVPVLNGNATSSYFYIHNDGDTEISGINYTLAGVSTQLSVKRAAQSKNTKVKSVSNTDVVDANGFVLDSASLVRCSRIAAHSFCKIEFTTPSLSPGNQNNSLFKVSVRDQNGFTHKYDQVINYVDYNVNLNNGVNFATSADVVADLTDRRYMMGYLVAGGAAGTIYNHVNLEISNGSSIAIRDGFINGREMASGELIPVNFNVQILSSLPSPENITPQYSQSNVSNHSLKDTAGQGQSLYLSTSSQIQSELSLKLGVIPILNAPTIESDAPTIYVSNFGEQLNGFTIEAANSNINLYSNTCGSVIESNGSCSFKLGVSTSNSGVTDLYFKINGQTVFTKAVYYSNQSVASLVSNFGASEIGLNPNQSSSIINYTFTNLSNIDLHSLVFNPQINGSSIFKIISNGCGDSIAANSQCVIQVQIIGDSSAERGIAYLDITGKSGSGESQQDFVSQSSIINYYVTDASVADKLVITNPSGSESSLSILGNGIESANSVFVISNPSANAIAISSIDLTGINVSTSGLSILANTCGNSLASGNTCQVTVNYGPLSPESNNSGIANLQVKYGSGNVITGIINYSVLALDSHLQITNVVAGSGFTGVGTEQDKYNGTGCNENPLTITITYKNMSTNFVAENLALNLIDGNVPPYYTVESSQTTCGYGSNPANLGIGSSCNLVLIADRSSMKYGDSFNLNINYPSASWNTTEGFINQNGFTYNNSTKLYANYTQPTLVSMINPESGNNLTRVLTQNLVNVNNCGDFITNIGAVSHESSIVINDGNCSIDNDGAVSCTNNSASAINKLTYQIDALPESADIFMIFNTSTTGKQIWYNPSILMFHVDAVSNYL